MSPSHAAMDSDVSPADGHYVEDTGGELRIIGDFSCYFKQMGKTLSSKLTAWKPFKDKSSAVLYFQASTNTKGLF